nr:immunoglobulin heavy chain junction region [Mus musculus]
KFKSKATLTVDTS